MSKTVYQDFDADALKYYDLETTPQYGVASSHTPTNVSEIKPVILSESYKTYKQIQDDLCNNNITVFGKEKRAFLLPRSPVSITRVKSALKEHGIILTSDYTDCDMVITHNQVGVDFRDGNTIQSTALMAKMWNFELLEKSTRTFIVEEYYKATGTKVIYDDKFTFNLWSEEYEPLIEGFMITGLAINLAHLIKINFLPVMDIQDVIYQSATKQIINDQLIQDITAQLGSGNVENVEMAGKLLPTIDYTKNYHLLWTLAHEINTYSYKFNKNKDVQYWLKASKMSDFYYKSAEEMILWLEETDNLDDINFRYLEPIVRREIRIDNRSLYVFKVQVKPEYRKFLKNKN